MAWWNHQSEPAIDLFGTTPRIQSHGRKATPQHWLALVGVVGLVFVAEAVAKSTSNGPAFDRWTLVMSHSVYAYMLLLFFPQVWQNWGDDKVPVVLVALFWLALVWEVWSGLNGPAHNVEIMRNWRVMAGASPAWQTYPPVERALRFALALGAAIGSGWLSRSIGHYGRRRQNNPGSVWVVGGGAVALATVVWVIVN